MKQPAPLISIIVPFFNIGTKIKKTLSSLLVQDQKDTFEVLFVNDGSSDNSVEIISTFKDISLLNYSIINQENKGVSAARNTGVIHSKGEYILFLDSDDHINEQFIQRVLIEIKKEPDMIYWGYDSVDEEGKVLQKFCDAYSYCDNVKELLSAYLSFQTWIWTGSALYKKTFLKKNKLNFTEGKVFSEDIEFIAKSIIKVCEMVCIHETLSYYVQNPTSITKKINYKRFQIIHTLKTIENQLENRSELNLFLQQFKPTYYWNCVTNLVYHGLEKGLIKKVSMNKEIRKQVKRYKAKTQNESVKKILFLYSPNLLYKIQQTRGEG